MAGILLPEASISDEERAAYTRALADKMRAASIARMNASIAESGETRMATALDVPGKILSDRTVQTEANSYAAELASGTRLRIIDLGGQQAVDFLCFDLADTAVRYNAANTIKLNEGIYVTTGFKLYSDIAEVMMTVVADTVGPGSHDTIGGACSEEVNYLRYGMKKTHSCRTNFLAALAARGMSARDIHANVNWFMRVPVHPDGSTAIEEGLSVPGDFVELRAEKDVLVVMSNCPQFYNPCSGWNPTPIRVIEWMEGER
jgi:hypothetical protein